MGQLDIEYDEWEEWDDDYEYTINTTEPHGLFPTLDHVEYILGDFPVIDGGEFDPVAGRITGRRETGWHIATVSQGEMSRSDYARNLGYLREDPYCRVRGESNRPLKIFIHHNYEPWTTKSVFSLLVLLEIGGAMVQWMTFYRSGEE